MMRVGRISVEGRSCRGHGSVSLAGWHQEALSIALGCPRDRISLGLNGQHWSLQGSHTTQVDPHLSLGNF